jgi:OOP family OmpA-OmpF porin
LPRHPFTALRVHSLIALAMVTAALACATDARAQTGFYAGGSIGQSHYKEQSPLSAPIDSANTGFKAYVGYQFNPLISIELGQAELGSFQAGVNSLKPSGAFLDLVSNVPIAPQWSLLARLGAFDNRTLRVVGGSSVLEKATNVKVGTGLQYELSPHTALRGEWERYGARVNGQTANTDLYTLGVVVRF